MVYLSTFVHFSFHFLSPYPVEKLALKQRPLRPFHATSLTINYALSTSAHLFFDEDSISFPFASGIGASAKSHLPRDLLAYIRRIRKEKKGSERGGWGISASCHRDFLTKRTLREKGEGRGQIKAFQCVCERSHFTTLVFIVVAKRFWKSSSKGKRGRQLLETLLQRVIKAGAATLVKSYINVKSIWFFFWEHWDIGIGTKGESHFVRVTFIANWWSSILWDQLEEHQKMCVRALDLT